MRKIQRAWREERDREGERREKDIEREREERYREGERETGRKVNSKRISIPETDQCANKTDDCKN